MALWLVKFKPHPRPRTSANPNPKLLSPRIPLLAEPRLKHTTSSCSQFYSRHRSNFLQDHIRKHGGITTKNSLSRPSPALQTTSPPCVLDRASLCIDEASEGIRAAVAERSRGAEGECAGICAYDLSSCQSVYYEANLAYPRPRNPGRASTQDGPRQ